jgi:hypothetical protein
MFADGLKDLQSDRTQVKDIAEVVAEGLRPVAEEGIAQYRGQNNG